MTPRTRSIVLIFIGIWALAALGAGVWLTNVSKDCEKYGDLQAECFAPVGVFTLKALFLLMGLSGLALWLIASRTKSDKGR